MGIDELDVVLLKDGQEATVLEIFPDNAFLVEVPDGDEYRNFAVKSEEIQRVTWKYHRNPQKP